MQDPTNEATPGAGTAEDQELDDAARKAGENLSRAEDANDQLKRAGHEGEADAAPEASSTDRSPEIGNRSSER